MIQTIFRSPYINEGLLRIGVLDFLFYGFGDYFDFWILYLYLFLLFESLSRLVGSSSFLLLFSYQRRLSRIRVWFIQSFHRLISKGNVKDWRSWLFCSIFCIILDIYINAEIYNYSSLNNRDICSLVFLPDYLPR